MRISPKARAYAKSRRGKVHPLDGLLDDDELGTGIGSLLGGIAGTVVGGPVGTALGSSIGGALLDGHSAAAPSSSRAVSPAAAAGGDAAAVLAALPGQGEVHDIVSDVLASHAGAAAAQEVQARAQAETARQAAAAVTAAVTPTVQRARGGIQEQRLQAQATAEHNAIMRREARDRAQQQRFDDLKALLNRVLAGVDKVNGRLSGRMSIVVGRAIDVLGGADALRAR